MVNVSVLLLKRLVLCFKPIWVYDDASNPKDKPGQVFEEDRIDRIKELLENSPGILLEDIREKLAFDYYKYYTKYHKENCANNIQTGN